MARKIITKTACINIVTHPHSKERYIELFNDIYGAKLPINVGNRKKIILGSLHENKIEGETALTGLFYRFLDIGGDWYNMEENTQASEKDLKEIHIPEHLRPDLTKHRFVFYPKSHKLFIQIKGESSGDNISIYQIEKYFSRLCEKGFIAEKYGEVFITVIPHSEQVEYMLSSKSIVELSYVIALPNPDFNDEDEVVEWMEEQEIEKDQRVLRSRKGAHLTPNQELKTIGRAAADNGKLSIKEKTETGMKILSTEGKPLIEDVIHDPKVESPTDTFWNQTIQMLRQIANRQ